jgi:hypothetical protein
MISKPIVLFFGGEIVWIGTSISRKCGTVIEGSMFRMSYGFFLTILDKIGTFMERHFTKNENTGGYISPSMQLGMALRFCVGGSYLDIHDRYDVSPSSFYSLVFT